MNMLDQIILSSFDSMRRRETDVMQSLLNLLVYGRVSAQEQGTLNLAPEHYMSCDVQNQRSLSIGSCDGRDNVECAELKVASLLVLTAPEDGADKIAQPVLAARKDVSVWLNG